MKFQIMFHSQKGWKRGDELKILLKLGPQYPRRTRNVASILLGISLTFDHGQSDEGFGFQLDDLRAVCSDSLFFSQDRQHIAERGPSFKLFYIAITEVI